MEKRYFHRDGSIVWINLTVSLIHEPDNAPKYFISVVEDISRRKQVEEEKKKVEAQLRHMQKMEAVGQLAGGIAHDFNNMLTAIIGNATLLQMKISEDVQLRHYTDEIVASSERAANLTRGLLAFSRKQMMDVKPVALNNIIKGVEKLISRLIGEDIELKVLSAKKDIIVRADAGQIEQVIMNLATNARDAMPGGGGLTIITEVINLDNEFVKAHGYGKPGVYALISVSDTGMGMEEDVKQKIFEPFFTTKELGKGTGLGLSIVYGIIKQHEGYINVYSEPNKGTTFRIYLPIIEIGIGAAELTKKVIGPERGTETVLLAEDEANVRRFVKTVLEEFGYTVIEAVDGEDAINKFQQNKEKIHLIILDVIMPRKSGREAYENIF
jgi:signal transduction histidine kinase